MERKGAAGSTAVLVTVILAAVVILVLGIFTKMYFGAANTEFTEKQCQSSLLMDAFGDFVRLVCIQPVDKLAIKCERKFVSLKDEEVYDKKGEEITHKYDANCPEGVSDTSCLQHSVLAHEMADCWRLMFKGEERLLGAAEKNSINLLASKDAVRACFVCAEVTIDQDANNFKEYLQKKVLVDDTTYFSYLAEHKKAICDSDLAGLQPSEINFEDKLHRGSCWEGMALGREKGWTDFAWPHLEYTDIPAKKYAVTFMRRGVGSCDIGDNKDETTVRDGYLTYTVQLVPADTINQHCTTVLV